MAEQLALVHLERQGLRLIERNFTCRGGEIDLIMEAGDSLGTVVMVEVRQRSSAHYGGAAASISASKRRRIVTAARVFLQRMPAWAARPCRFDVVAIDGPLTDPRLSWLQGAFESGG